LALPGPAPLELGELNSLARIPAFPERFPFTMDTIRQEVQALVRTTERLLSPITLGEPLNEDERDMVAMCAQSLAEKYPMSLAQPTRKSVVRSRPLKEVPDPGRLE
jgi:hypothetical protein